MRGVQDVLKRAFSFTRTPRLVSMNLASRSLFADLIFAQTCWNAGSVAYCARP
jgi:hypothetical protein